jgi:hypothetical protein
LTGNVGKGMPFAGVQRHKLHLERAKFVTGSSRWVKGQAQGLQADGFKLWVNYWIHPVQPPTEGMFSEARVLAHCTKRVASSFWRMLGRSNQVMIPSGLSLP